MKIAGILANDIIDGDDGVTVSLWVQGCHFHCDGCHNKHAWDFNGGTERDKDDVVSEIKKLIVSDGIKRNFSVLGGEPLCDENVENVKYVISKIREEFPDIRILVWTGYTFEELNNSQKEVLPLIDVLIDGRFKKELHEPDLKLRGSTNQRILSKGVDF